MSPLGELLCLLPHSISIIPFDLTYFVQISIRKLFIGGLSYGTDDGRPRALSFSLFLLSFLLIDKLKSYFEQYGSVQDAVVMKDPVTRRSRGFGFITYTHPAYVDQALAIGIHVIDSRKVHKA
jgi:RNA recognition motif-containing protein